MDNTCITTDAILQNYINELNSDVKLSISNLREKALLCSSIWAKWLSYLYHEKEQLTKLSEAKIAQTKKKLSTNSGIQDSVLRMKSESKILENDETLQKINSLTKQVQEHIDYIERALNILSGFSFNIKNVFEIMKLNLDH